MDYDSDLYVVVATGRTTDVHLLRDSSHKRFEMPSYTVYNDQLNGYAPFVHIIVQADDDNPNRFPSEALYFLDYGQSPTFIDVKPFAVSIMKQSSVYNLNSNDNEW